MRSRRGMLLVEAIVWAGLLSIVMSVGFGVYIGLMRIDDVESRREMMTISTQSLMKRIKSDIRAGSGVSASGGTLVIHGTDGAVTYRNLRDGSGVERIYRTKSVRYKGLQCKFKSASDGSSGANVTLISNTTIHRRPIKVEISSFICPRNR